MRSTLRHAAAAAAAGIVIAIGIDVVLQFLTASIRITGGMRPSWRARAAAHAVWLVLAALVWLAAPLMAASLDDIVPSAGLSRRTVWALVGTAFIALPALQVIAELAVLAGQLTVSGTWASEGFIFISGAYYGTVMLVITPWMAAGAILRAWATHLID
jgi:hypothetical protein